MLKTCEREGVCVIGALFAYKTFALLRGDGALFAYKLFCSIKRGWRSLCIQVF